MSGLNSGLWASGLAAGISVAALSAALGQTLELPQITVEAPSPILRQTPAPLVPGSLIVVPDAFAPVTVVTEQDIARSPGQTLGDLLGSRPGISSSSFAPGAASRPVIRGLDNYRVRIQENGLGAHGVSEIGEDHAVPVDPLAAQRIEVIRGPATLRYGSPAIGGVVSVTNNRIPDRMPQRPLSFEARGGVSSVDRGVDGAALVDIGSGRFALHADMFGRGASDYRIPTYPYLFPEDPAPAVTDGRQPNSSLRASGQSMGGSYFFDGGFVGLAVTNYSSFYRTPGEEPTEHNTRLDVKQTKVQSKGEFRPQSSAVDVVRFWFGASNYRHYERADEGGFDGIQQTFTNREQEGRVEVQLTPFVTRFGTLTTAIGAHGGHQRMTAPGTEGGLFDPNRTRTVAGFVFNEFDFGQGTRAQLAGRIEHVNITGSVPDLFVDPDAVIARNLGYTPKSVSAGLLQNLPMGLVASVTGQYVERAPRAPELLSRGIHEATETFDIGNPNLGLERAQTIEFGLKRAQGAFRFDAAVYHTRFRGFIYRRLTGETCDEDFASCSSVGGAGGELNEAIYDQRNANFTGAEIAAQLDVAPIGNGMFGVDGQYDIVRARFDDGSSVPRLPPQRFGGGLWWRSAEWFARVGALHGLAQTRIGENETPTASFTLLKAELSHTRKFGNSRAFGTPQEMTVGIVGDNLLDEDVRNHVSFRKDQVLLPGRNIRAFAKVKF
jgi:iron complex outermembrane recepter protein